MKIRSSEVGKCGSWEVLRGLELRDFSNVCKTESGENKIKSLEDGKS